MKSMHPLAFGATLWLAACSSPEEQAREQVEDQIEQAAEQSADQAGNAIAALNLTERQLLDADLVGTDGTELGDVTALTRGSTGAVEGLLIEVEDSNPDRFVSVALDGLSPQQDGNDWNIVTSLSREQIAALPDVPIAGAAGTGAQQNP